MIRVLVFLSLSLWPAAVSAQDWDWPATGFNGLSMGLIPRFHDPDRPRFGPEGSLRGSSAVTDPNGGPVYFGGFTLMPDGRLCLANGEGGGDCNLYMRDGSMRMLVTQGGKRLPFRFELGLGN